MIILDDSIILENNECKTLSLIGGTDIKLQYKNIEKAIGQASRVVYDARSSNAVNLLIDNIDRIKDDVLIHPMSWINGARDNRIAGLCWYNIFEGENKSIQTDEQKLLSILVLRATIYMQRELKYAEVSISYGSILSAKIEFPFDACRIFGYIAQTVSRVSITLEKVAHISDELWKHGWFIVDCNLNGLRLQGQRDTIRIGSMKAEFKDDDVDDIQEILSKYNVLALSIRRFTCL